MEEWRALLCDSLAVSLLSHKVIKIDDFLDPDEETGGVYLRQEASKNFIEHFEQRIRKLNSYLDFVDYPMSFRESITLQVGSFVKAIESADPEIYRPILIR
jgi:CRISPR-associated protein Cas1